MFYKVVKKFLDDEKSVGLVLIVCTIISLLLANSVIGSQYLSLWYFHIGGLSLEHWINDGLMTLFFLTIGLELGREIHIGEFSKPKNVVLPIAAAIGGMLVPAALYFFFNKGLPTVSGIGISMATDIAFALGILSLLGKRVPFSLKVFLMALAVVDDLGAIIVIAVFYTKNLVVLYLFASLAVFAVLIVLNRLKVTALIPYLVGGVFMWYFMLQSGIHATISGVLLASVIPFAKRTDAKSPSLYLMHKLHVPVSFVVLPIFALANTAIMLSLNVQDVILHPVSYGIFTGLFIGKPLGIALASSLVVFFKLAEMPKGVNWRSLLGVSFLGGIGFTMSIFITLLAFDDSQIIDLAKIVILITSSLAGVTGYFYLRFTLKENKEI